jgi:hypothetical protein
MIAKAQRSTAKVSQPAGFKICRIRLRSLSPQRRDPS